MRKKIKIGIPRALLYYYDETLWLEFFKNLHIQTVTMFYGNHFLAH